MPQNMQRRPKVKRLELEEEQETEDLELEANLIAPRADKEYYDIALKYLRRDMKAKDIANKLVSEGMSRTKAKQLVEQVVEENPNVARTNAYILLGIGAVFAIPGVLLLLIDLLNAETFAPIPYLALILFGAWFLYKGVQTFRVKK